MNTLYTIGYATKSFDSFSEQLKSYKVNALVDVRSVPFSARFKEYDQGNLQRTLKALGVHYIYMGNLLGPRSKNPDHYDQHRQVDFSKLKKSNEFLQGVGRLKLGCSKNYIIAMMCAEKDPACCHRSLLISSFLHEEHNWDVQHILHNGEVENQADLIERLIQEQGLSSDMLSDEASIAKQAYDKQCRSVNYKRPS